MTPRPVIVGRNPITPRFATISGSDGGLSTWQRQSFFKFDNDATVHWILVNSSLKLTAGPGSVECGIALNTNGDSPTISLGQNSFGTLYYDSAVINLADPTQLVKTSVQIDMKDLAVKSGSVWGLYLLANNSCVASGQVIICFTTVTKR